MKLEESLKLHLWRLFVRDLLAANSDLAVAEVAAKADALVIEWQKRKAQEAE